MHVGMMNQMDPDQMRQMLYKCSHGMESQYSPPSPSLTMTKDNFMTTGDARRRKTPGGRWSQNVRPFESKRKRSRELLTAARMASMATRTVSKTKQAEIGGLSAGLSAHRHLRHKHRSPHLLRSLVTDRTTFGNLYKQPQESLTKRSEWALLVTQRDPAPSRPEDRDQVNRQFGSGERW